MEVIFSKTVEPIWERFSNYENHSLLEVDGVGVKIFHVFF